MAIYKYMCFGYTFRSEVNRQQKVYLMIMWVHLCISGWYIIPPSPPPLSYGNTALPPDLYIHKKQEKEWEEKNRYQLNWVCWQVILPRPKVDWHIKQTPTHIYFKFSEYLLFCYVCQKFSTAFNIFNVHIVCTVCFASFVVIDEIIRIKSILILYKYTGILMFADGSELSNPLIICRLAD